MNALEVDVAILGAGPAGMAAALAAKSKGSNVVLVEREDRPGGVLKQCIHDGFGLVRYKEKLTGPEYALRDADALVQSGIPVFAETFVSTIHHEHDRFILTCINRQGILTLTAAALVLATGCRERTDRQVFIHGDRPAGIFTAGLAQRLVNIEGLLPGRNAVILGSGDIGLIMARRLTLEGMHVVGAFEVRPEPSGLQRNIRQCLDDYAIPLHLSTTVTEVHGRNRVESVTVAGMGADGRPVSDTSRNIPCDTLVLSVGLIPENELAVSVGVPIDPSTGGPTVDQTMHTLVDGVFACGNAVHVNDLVDYVSESGSIAGAAAARWAAGCRPARQLVPVAAGKGLRVVVPQRLDLAVLRGGEKAGGKSHAADEVIFYFRSSKTMAEGATVALDASSGHDVGMAGAKDRSRTSVWHRKYTVLRPPEAERIALDAGTLLPCTSGATFGVMERPQQ